MSKSNNKAQKVKETETKVTESKTPQVKSKTNEKEVKPKVVVKEVKEESSDSDSDSESDNEEQPPVQLDSESESDSDSESEDEGDKEDKAKKTKERKARESLTDLLKRLDELRTQIKTLDKEVTETELTLKTKKTQRRQLEREMNPIFAILEKTHTDEVNRARKEKKKRNGSGTGGFNKLLKVPTVLAQFIGIEDGTEFKRPALMSAFNDKVKELKLKDGQSTILDKKAVKQLQIGDDLIQKLGLEKQDNGSVLVKFTQVHSLLASYFPKEVKAPIVVQV